MTEANTTYSERGCNNVINNTGTYIILSVLLALAVTVVHFLFAKADIHLWLNSYHTPLQDNIWKYYTYAGEWIPYVIAALLLFYRFGYAAFLLADIVLSGIIAQIIKHIVCSERPLLYFINHYPDIKLPLVEGVGMNMYFSFPSGHTTTFFAMMFVLAIVFTDCVSSHQDAEKKDKQTVFTNLLVSLICFLFAVAGAYSRIYLNQHFLEDIFGGIIIGISSTMLLIPFALRLGERKWWQLNLIRLFC